MGTEGPAKDREAVHSHSRVTNQSVSNILIFVSVRYFQLRNMLSFRKRLIFKYGSWCDSFTSTEVRDILALIVLLRVNFYILSILGVSTIYKNSIIV